MPLETQVAPRGLARVLDDRRRRPHGVADDAQQPPGEPAIELVELAELAGFSAGLRALTAMVSRAGARGAESN